MVWIFIHSNLFHPTYVTRTYGERVIFQKRIIYLLFFDSKHKRVTSNYNSSPSEFRITLGNFNAFDGNADFSVSHGPVLIPYVFDFSLDKKN